MKLAELQEHMWRLLHEGLLTTRLEAALTSPERAEIYLEMYRARLLEALQQDFAVLARVIGEAEFIGLAKQYIDATPSEHPSLAKLGSRFPASIGDSALSALATLEWARAEVFDAPASPVAVLGELAESSGLELIPALQTLSLDFDVVSAWQQASTPVRCASDVIVWRKALTVYHAAVSHEEATALAKAREGATLAEICASSSDAAAAATAIGSWFNEGFIARVVAVAK